jgi:hypothetical protein
MIHTDSPLLPFVRFNIPLAPDYEDDKIRLRETWGELNLRLFDGEREAVAESDAGILKSTGERLIARVVFKYKYNPVKNEIEICNNNFKSDKSTSFTLTTQSGKVLGEFRACHEWEDFLKAGNNAGFTLHEGHFHALQDSLHGIHKTVEGSLLENRVGVLVHNQFPKELEDKLAVYRHGVLSHVFDPKHDDESIFLDKSFTTAPIKSAVPGTTETWKQRDAFLNVIGSTGDNPYWSGDCKDPRAAHITNGTTWRDVWSWVVCREEGGGHFCSSATNDAAPQLKFNHRCTLGDNYVGAHVISGKTYNLGDQKVEHGKDSVRIIPACHWVNTGHSDKVFQIMHPFVPAVVLNNYHVP